MKNKEKFIDKLADFACDGNERIALNTKGEIVGCSSLFCENCKFYTEKDCGTVSRKWLEEEYVEPQVISKKDRSFLEYLREDCKYIARDENGNLFVYREKPTKSTTCWNMRSLVCDSYLYLNRHFNVDFPMVKWTDVEPWKIKDLMNLNLVDEYE